MNWREKDISRLRELAFAEKSNSQIAEAMGITVSEVYAKRSSLGITIAKVQAAKAGIGTKQKENPEPDTQGQTKVITCPLCHREMPYPQDETVEDIIRVEDVMMELSSTLYMETSKILAGGLSSSEIEKVEQFRKNAETLSNLLSRL